MTISDDNKTKAMHVVRRKAGRKLSDEHKRKISLSMTGRKLSDEHKRKVSLNHRGMKGKHHSSNTRKRISESNHQRLRSEEEREAVILSLENLSIAGKSIQQIAAMSYWQRCRWYKTIQSEEREKAMLIMNDIAWKRTVCRKSKRLKIRRSQNDE